MSTQKDILNKACGANVSKGKHRHDLKPRKISKLLRNMYRLTYSPEAVNHFYYQHENGTPLFQVETNIGGKKDYYRVAFKNEIKLKDWDEVERPENFSGSVWPPKCVSDLLGCSTNGETCVECAMSEGRKKTGNTYMEWSTKMHEFWLENIRLCAILKIGYGLRARNHISANTCIGEYTGELIPADETLSDERTQYHFEIDIGKIAQEGEVQVMCWLDATEKGSIFRFANHSCDPNASVDQGQCGIHNRILYVYTLKDIEEGEQITISYGDDWFSDKSEPCRCGSKKCKNPPKKTIEAKSDARKEPPKKAKEKKKPTSSESPPKEDEDNKTVTRAKAAAPKKKVRKEPSPGPRGSPRLASESPTRRISPSKTPPVLSNNKKSLRRKLPVVIGFSDDEGVAPPKKGAPGGGKARNRS